MTSTAGTGPQTLDWIIESGDWTTITIYADASSGVTAELAFAIGLISLIGGGLLLYLGFRRRGGDSTSPPGDIRNEQSP